MLRVPDFADLTCATPMFFCSCCSGGIFSKPNGAQQTSSKRTPPVKTGRGNAVLEKLSARAARQQKAPKLENLGAFHLLFLYANRETTTRRHIHFNMIAIANDSFFNHVTKLMVAEVRVLRITVNLCDVIYLRLKEININVNTTSRFIRYATNIPLGRFPSLACNHETLTNFAKKRN